MDVVGKCDPFFKASLDGEIKFMYALALIKPSYFDRISPQFFRQV